MSKKRFIATVVIAFLSTSSIIIACAHSIEAQTPSDFIQFVDSGVTIFSPLNATYYYKNFVLNLSLWSAGDNGILDPLISMNYTIDSIYNGSVPLKSIGVDHYEARAVGVVALPELPKGSHYLTIYLYGLNQKWIDPRYLSFINTVYFSTLETNPNLSPTMSPLTTPSVSPTIAEFPSTSVIASFIIATIVGLVILKRKQYREDR